MCVCVCIVRLTEISKRTDRWTDGRTERQIYRQEKR